MTPEILDETSLDRVAGGGQSSEIKRRKKEINTKIEAGTIACINCGVSEPNALVLISEVFYDTGVMFKCKKCNKNGTYSWNYMGIKPR